jgi:hypothetical protein
MGILRCRGRDVEVEEYAVEERVVDERVDDSADVVLHPIEKFVAGAQGGEAHGR